jgi:uncharacterized protein with von Willebrand factor type A (vWA) domain
VDAEELLALSDNWVGEGGELARRVLAFAGELRFSGVSIAASERGGPAQITGGISQQVADDLEAIVRREYDPTVSPGQA